MSRMTGLICAMALAAAPAAMAQVTVIGGGIARDCYEATKFGSQTPGAIEQICTKAIEVEAMNLANKAATYTNRGVVRMRQGKLEAAMADYAISKRLRPEVGATYLNEGAAFILQKDYESALASLEQAIALDTTELHAAYYNRAIAREQMGDVEGAYYDFKKAGELKPGFDLVEKQLSRFVVTTN